MRLPVVILAAALSATAAPGGAEPALFAEHCAACHGDAGEGIAGIAPSLSDGDWIWGGDPEAIYETIAWGVRAGGFFSRNSEMPRFLEDGLLDEAAIAAVAAHVVGLGAGPGAAQAEPGATLYANQCAGCHGDAGEGMQTIGAPRLSDDVWLYGGAVEEIAVQIGEPQHGVMPGWLDTLGEAAVRGLVDHVLSLCAADCR